MTERPRQASVDDAVLPRVPRSGASRIGAGLTALDEVMKVAMRAR